MNNLEYIKNILSSEKLNPVDLSLLHDDELYVTVDGADFVKTCNLLHKRLESAAMMFFAQDLRLELKCFALYCVFLSTQTRSWVLVRQDIAQNDPKFSSLAKDIYSASLFEREIKEMFGLMPIGNPDLRRLRLHDEVWPEGYYPLLKDFSPPQDKSVTGARYQFKRVEGEGIFEVPVGPVHAGIIGPGHFRFSAAGEPIINLEMRLGWTHRGIEKLLEGKDPCQALAVFEHISGDTAFGYSLAFCRSIERILGVNVPLRAQLLRVLFLELERLYNHANDLGGIALDVGFSFPAQFASIIKETILQLNQSLSSSRYLKGINAIGGVNEDMAKPKLEIAARALAKIREDFLNLEEMLISSVSFMDRIDSTGTLHTKTARDLGVTGLAGRASGIALDLRKVFPDIYASFSFSAAADHSGDVAARLKVRFSETRESISIIKQCLEKLDTCKEPIKISVGIKEGVALGYVEAWRGPVLVWTRLNAANKIERCKIVDPSFHNWEALTYAVLGNIIPDFPLCNKSFDLSYPGNDL